MFQGSVPASVQMMIKEVSDSWDVRDIYIGCSGNFTIERVLFNSVKANLHGNDVSIYSCILGSYLSGQKIEAVYNEAYQGKMEFVKKYMTSDASIASTVLLLSRLAPMLGAKKTNMYYDRMINAYIEQWDALFDATLKTVEAVPRILKTFSKMDVVEWIKGLDREQGIMSYPPFFKGGYEKMFAVLGDIILWEAPQYGIMDKEGVHALFREMTGFKHFLFASDEELEEFKEFHTGVSQTTVRNLPVYVYSNQKKSRIVMPCQKLENPVIPRIGAEEEIGEKMTLAILKSGEFQALRSHYLNPHIKPGSESLALGVMVDGKLVGVFAVSTAPTLGNWDKYVETPTVYLLSDFPVAPTKYKRLAKLVLYASVSKESKLILEELSNKRAKTIVTTAFAKNPVSMKYRGLFDLMTKKEIEMPSNDETDISKVYYGSGYALNYGSPLGRWTLQEGLELWKKKHSQVWGDEGVAEK